MSEEDQVQTEKKVKRNYRKEKPWDNDTIDHWKIEKFEEGEMKGGSLTEESSFATLFPAYREKYLREVWPLFTRELKKTGVACELDLVEGSMTVKTTRKTWDPYSIVKARDAMKLLARSIPVKQALRVLEDDINCDIIKIGGMVRNKERFVKRRMRLVGPNGSTLKAIELLTGCYVLVQGNTVSAMGSYKGLKQCRKIIEDCMNNIHPIYNIKTLMIKNELAKDPQLASENWERFLPKFEKQNVQRKKVTIIKKKYTPFPPQNHQMASKVDLELESGEYFMSQHARLMKKKAEKKEVNVEKAKLRKIEKEKDYIAPKESSSVEGKDKKRKRKKNNDSSAESAVVATTAVDESESVSDLKERALKRQKVEVAKKSISSSDYLIASESTSNKEMKKAKKEKKKKKEKKRED